MAKTHFPLAGGNQWAGAFRFYDFACPMGNVFFVSSVTGTNSTGGGRSPETALATIDYAVGLCTASNDDWIIVLPGHVETINAAGALAIDVAGITIKGIGRGTKQPKLDFTTSAAATCTMSAVNCVLDNFQIEASFADIVSEIVVSGTDCVIRNCRFLEPVTDENALINILGGTTNACDNLVVENCEFRGLDAANTHAVSLPSAETGVIVRNNYLLGVFETAGIGGATAQVQIIIENNYINNTSGDADECILMAAASTGLCVRNLVGNNLAGNATTNINCGATMTICENYSTDKGDVQGVLDPVAT